MSHASPPAFTPPALIPPLRLRTEDGVAYVGSLDEALAFALTHTLPKGDYEGLIRRLEVAREREDVIEAGNAFRWWAQSNGILVENGTAG
ncbi:hypothetical protein FHS55_002774 [Angulomicrobium tetraedrale]|uniref:Uncharacterized protein n=1 Tax=Ancylobacter tetraedralis TaxID=217068 RepID=A0A839ZBU2_9HYPH|nr:hypothetical protein [Ancylobacter tetraedralis]MBB3772162.1 hypothetical protein [Ancylobacter tetraedralis]